MFSHGLTNKCGVAILTPPNIDFKVIDTIRDNEGRFLKISIEINDTLFYFINIYVPTKDHKPEQNKFLEFLLHHLTDICDENVLVGGDFNITLNPELDKKGWNCEQHSAYKDSLKGFLDTYDMVDIWRNKHHDVSLFTYFSKKPIILSRIDFWLVPSFLSRFIKSDIKHSIKSDHSVFC